MKSIAYVSNANACILNGRSTRKKCPTLKKLARMPIQKCQEVLTVRPKTRSRQQISNNSVSSNTSFHVSSSNIYDSLSSNEWRYWVSLHNDINSVANDVWQFGEDVILSLDNERFSLVSRSNIIFFVI